MFRMLFFTSAISAFSALLLLTVDREYYRVNGMTREHKASAILSWIQIAACLVFLLMVWVLHY
ncbi:hypothetical protein PSTEL_07275 [Paenibacillus stellifer]|uniref:Uncharacterized protein n=1 Tax=Paenibacillus stellifer TaxID=169760 RepID=A0A089LS82_9BACL|nr:hypothetical protein PSTEL_07275 [Paenibacillus stellifer]